MYEVKKSCKHFRLNIYIISKYLYKTFVFNEINILLVLKWPGTNLMLIIIIYLFISLLSIYLFIFIQVSMLQAL